MEVGTDIFDDVVVIFIAAALGGLAARLARLPALVGYLAVGAVVGPQALGLVTNIGDVQTLAELGVILLLFAVGVEVSISDLRRVGWRVLVASAAQIILTVGVGYGIGAVLGWGPRQSLVAGMVLSLSSTMVALKTLNDRGELGALHGRMATGMLLMQDLAFVPMMAVLAALGEEGGSLAVEIAISAGKAVAVLGLILLVGLFVPWLLKRVALLGARETFVVTVLAATLGAATLTEWAGLSAALGAFVAGLVISDSDWAGRRALSEVIPLRDIFAGFFFVSLGMLTDFEFLLDHAGEVGLFIAASIVVKLVLVGGLVRALGYLPNTALRTGFLMIQIGEFSFIVAGAATTMGIVDDSLLPLTVTAAVVTMGVTPAFINAGSRALDLLQARSRRFRRYLAGEALAESARERAPRFRGHVIIAGFGRVGSLIAGDLDRQKIPHIAIELDPARMEMQVGPHGYLLYGDSASEPALIAAGVEHAKLIIAAAPDHVSNLVTVQHARRLNPGIHIVGRAAWEEEVQALYDMGADAVVWPELEAALEIMRISLRDAGVAGAEVEELIEEARAELGDLRSEDDDAWLRH